MINKVFNIFNNTSFKESVSKYFQLGKELKIIPLDCNIINDDAFISLQRLLNMEHVYRNDVLQTIDLLHRSALQKNRSSQIYTLLGEMVCYWALKEYSMVRKIQDNVRCIEYGSSWWERNKKGLASIAGGILAGAMMIAGGGGGSIAGPMVAGGKASGECVDDHAELEWEFNQLKEAIINTNFNIK